jgi:hypothetical protein
LNPEIDNQEKERMKERFFKKKKEVIYSKIIQRELRIEKHLKEIEKIENMLIPHPTVEKDVNKMEPITIDQIRQTNEIFQEKAFNLSCGDPNAIYHIMNQIAQNQRVDFVILNLNEKNSLGFN